MRVTWPIAFAVAVFAGSALAQTNPEEQARRLLEDGRTYREQGKLKQALDNFNTVITGFPETAAVDDALLEIGRYHIEVEGDDRKGREALEQVTQRFPQSDGAPGAYYYLGWLTLRRASSQGELDDALAQFTRVRRLYPRSTWVARALYASGLAYRKGGDYPEAVAHQRRVTMEYPTSDVAAAAQFEVGQCLALQGEALPAMEEFQRVRNRFGGSRWSQDALNRITALYRLHAHERPSFTLDSSFSVGSGEALRDVRAILADPSGTLWVASDKVHAAVPFGPDGRTGGNLGAQDLQSLTLTPGGDLMVVARRSVRMGAKDIKSFAVPGSKPGELEELDGIAAAVQTPSGGLLVSDDKRKQIFRYGSGFDYLGVFPDNRERQARRMLVDGEGGIVILDERTKGVQVYDEQGRPLRSLPARGTGYELKRPVDLAVDPFRNLYLIDEKAGVCVFSPEGRLLATVGGGEVVKPQAVTLDSSGAILVYDEAERRIKRFR